MGSSPFREIFLTSQATFPKGWIYQSSRLLYWAAACFPLLLYLSTSRSVTRPEHEPNFEATEMLFLKTCFQAVKNTGINFNLGLSIFQVIHRLWHLGFPLSSHADPSEWHQFGVPPCAPVQHKTLGCRRIKAVIQQQQHLHPCFYIALLSF